MNSVLLYAIILSKEKLEGKNLMEVKGMWNERIAIDPEILVGKPIIKGTRIAVDFILELMGNGWSYEQILENYPQLKKEDIMAAIKYSVEILKDEKSYALK